MTDEKLTPFKAWLAGQKTVTIEVDKGDGSAETCDLMVCVPFTIERGFVFPDNRIGKCEGCGCAVQFRPHAPIKPKRVCYACVEKFQGGGDDKVTAMITPKTAAELALFYSKWSKH